MYDRDNPAVLIVMQSPKYVFIHNPNAAFGGPGHDRGASRRAPYGVNRPRISASLLSKGHDQ